MNSNRLTRTAERARARARGRGRHALTALLTIGVAACGDSGGSTEPELPGSISLTVVTTGFLQDDGYELFVNGTSHGTIAAETSMTLSGLDVGSYELSLGDVADNCSVSTASASVTSGGTAPVEMVVDCAAGTASNYTIRASRDRPNLDDGSLVSCSFGLCPSDTEWDVFVSFNTSSSPQSVINQNEVAALEIAHVVGVTLADLTEDDYESATFTTERMERAFSSGSTVLVRSTDGNVYALGNPVEDTLLMTLNFDAVLIASAS